MRPAWRVKRYPRHAGIYVSKWTKMFILRSEHCGSQPPSPRDENDTLSHDTRHSHCFVSSISRTSDAFWVRSPLVLHRRRNCSPRSLVANSASTRHLASANPYRIDQLRFKGRGTCEGKNRSVLTPFCAATVPSRSQVAATSRRVRYVRQSGSFCGQASRAVGI